jgi:hypothetical protein
MSKFILSLEEISKDDTARAGFNGVELALLFASGLPVPNALVVSAEAYAKRIALLNLEGRLEEVWNDATALNSFADEARAVIIEEGLGDLLAREIASTAWELGTPMIDVMLSPALASHDAAAIAGLGWSAAFLPSEAAVDAVEECWAMPWGKRQLAFRQRAGIEPGPSAPWGVAVLITATEPSPLRGVIVPTEQSGVESDAWVIRVEPRLPGGQEIEIEKSNAEKTGSPLTSAQAEALTILADGAAEAFGEPRALRWRFDGRLFTIVGTFEVHKGTL